MARAPARVRPGLDSQVKTTFALPAPLWFAASRCNHATFAEAVQAAVAGVTARTTLSLPAAGPSQRALAPKLLVGCKRRTVTVKLQMLVLPRESNAVLVTAVVPKANVLPEGRSGYKSQ